MINIKHSSILFFLTIMINIFILFILADFFNLFDKTIIFYLITSVLFLIILSQLILLYINIYKIIKSKENISKDIKIFSSNLENKINIIIEKLEKGDNINPDMFSIDSFNDLSKTNNNEKLKYVINPNEITNNINNYQNKLNKYKNIYKKNEELILNNNYKIFKITNREKDIIKLISKGMESKEIGHLLNISINTVNNHIKNIYKKCDVQNKIELINILKSPVKLINFS